MHTADLMKTGEFGFFRGEEPVGFQNIFPGFTAHDRLGIVAMEPGDTLRAAPLLLASVGAFYEELRTTESDFYLYPDFFVFHMGELRGRHSPFDVWPQTKEVVVPPDPQALLAAINDRGITRLILPNAPGSAGVVMVHAAQLAARRLRTVLTTAAGAADQPWRVLPSKAAARMIARCADVSADLLGEEPAKRWRRDAGSAHAYTELTVEEALSALCAVGTTDDHLGFEEDYRSHAGLREAILARDRYIVSAPPSGAVNGSRS